MLVEELRVKMREARDVEGQTRVTADAWEAVVEANKVMLGALSTVAEIARDAANDAVKEFQRAESEWYEQANKVSWPPKKEEEANDADD